MRLRTGLGVAAAAAGTAALGILLAAYRRDMNAIAAELQSGGRRADTAVGTVEYAREGRGPAALVVHGAGGGYDQGLFLGRELLGGACEIIAPSRFGYLDTPLPEAPAAAAQADAHAALLDALSVPQAIVLGVSAGAPSAIELALRHPERVSALILAVPRAWSPEGEVAVEGSAPSQAVLRAVLTGADLAFWLAAKLARPWVVRFLGVRPEVEAAAPAAERERVDRVIRSILPLSRRFQGIIAEGFAPVGPWPLERIRVPTLVISADDDLFNTLPGARFTAAHIAGAELLVLESGGHLMVARGDEVRRAIAGFLRRRVAGPRLSS